MSTALHMLGRIARPFDLFRDVLRQGMDQIRDFGCSVDHQSVAFEKISKLLC